jgi:putative acetyltransferase
MVHIRPEHLADIAGIRAVNLAAFETATEADLVDVLREQARPVISLVADDEGTPIGHILFSPVTLVGHPELNLMGLAPMAVVPERQRQGIGSALVREGLDACARLGVDGVVVLGHAEYYPRFGFARAVQFGIHCEYDVPAEYFMLLELKHGVLRSKSGTARYHAAFASA